MKNIYNYTDLYCVDCNQCSVIRCDKSCAAYTTGPTLLEFSEIDINKRPPQSATCDKYNGYDWQQLLRLAEKCGVFIIHTDGGLSSQDIADAVTYQAISNYHKNSVLRPVVFQLHFQEYIDAVKDSWSRNGQLTEKWEIEEMRMNESKILILAGMDFTMFGETETQKLLQIVDKRYREGVVTILVIPPYNRCAGKGDLWYGRGVPLLKSLESKQNAEIAEARKKGGNLTC